MTAAPIPPSGTAPPSVEEWEAGGRRVEVEGHGIFVVEAGMREGPVPLLVLHGYPTSSYDFWRVLPALSRDRPLIVHDHPGFGLSAKPAEYSYSLVEQAEIALALWDDLGVREAHLLAHDYGTSVATEILARREEGALPLRLRSVTLCNGSVFVEMSRPRPIQRLLATPLLGEVVARLATESTFRRQMRRIWGRERPPHPRELQTLWTLLVRDGGRRRIATITRYLGERRRRYARWTEPLDRLDLPAHVLWGMDDPVAVPAIGRRLADRIPGARFSRLEGVGHYPMLEAPTRWSRAVSEFLVDAEAPGAG